MYREVALPVAQPTSGRTQETQATEGEVTTIIIMITIIEGQEEIDEIGSVLGAMIVGKSLCLVHDGLGVEGGIEHNVGASSRSPALIRVSCTYPIVIYKSTVTRAIRVHSCSVHTLMFFPPLDSTVVVDIPSNARAGGLSLLFRARTGSASALEQLKRDGVKVQVWTNAPVDNDHTDGKWGAYNFEAPAATPAKLDDSIASLPLPPPTRDNIVDEPHTLFLTLRLGALPQSQSETDFLVTYRLLYPNGEVKWLGYHGRDLRCVLKKTDPWLAPPTPASPSSGDVYRTFSTITMKEPWGCWAIGPRRSVQSCRSFRYPQGLTSYLSAQCEVPP